MGNTKMTYLQDTHLRLKATQGLKVKGWRKTFHSDRNEKAGVVILRQNTLQTKNIKRQRRNYIILKGPIQEEDIAIVNIYTPNIGALEYKYWS